MRFTPTDIIVLALALTICVALLATVVVPIYLGEPLSDARSNSLSGISGAIITLITIYIKDKLKGDD